MLPRNVVNLAFIDFRPPLTRTTHYVVRSNAVLGFPFLNLAYALARYLSSIWGYISPIPSRLGTGAATPDHPLEFPLLRTRPMECGASKQSTY